MEKLQWFKFSPIDWKMGKIQSVPEITQLKFIQLICLYWNKECILSYEDAEIAIDAYHLEILILKKIVKINGTDIVIDFLSEQIQDISESKKGKSNNGKIGNLKRWNPELYKEYIDGKISIDDAINVAKQSHSDSDPIATQSQNIAEKRREEKSNNNLSVNWDGLIGQFNDITGKKSKVISEKAKRQVKARLKEGYSKQDIVDAIINCYNDKYHKETNHKYLTLEFISREDKMEKYSVIKTNNKFEKEVGQL